MTRILVLAFVIVAAVVAPRPAEADRAAPEFTAVAVDGLAVSLASFKEQKHLVVVFYWNHG